MPELKKCPDYRVKAGECSLIYNSMHDKLEPWIPNLIYGVRFLCLTCDQIYENTQTILSVSEIWANIRSLNP